MTSKLKQSEPITLQTFQVYGMQTIANTGYRTPRKDDKPHDIHPSSAGHVECEHGFNLSDLLLDDTD